MGYGGQLVANDDYRATDKNRLLEVEDPVGPENDKMILEMAKEAKIVVLAFGQPPKKLRSRGQELTNLLNTILDFLIFDFRKMELRVILFICQRI